MKIILLALLLAVTCQAQTFVRYTLTSTNVSDNVSMTFTVPTNTIFKGSVTPYVASGITYSANVQAVYPDSTNCVDLGQSINREAFHTESALGPATIIFSGSLNPNTTSVLIAEFDPVNTTPAIQGFAVQPANSSAQINLETSTDLKTWQSTTNGVYGLTNSARFFRMNLTVQP